MGGKKIYHACGKADCFGCKDGKCDVLMKNNFGGRDCPFFKTEEQVQTEKAYCAERLRKIINNTLED